MTVRTLAESPSLGGLYAKAVLPAVPGLNRVLPVGGPGPKAPAPDALPDVELRLPGIAFDPGHVARYGQVCGYHGLTGTGAASGQDLEVPATYPHVLAFPLHLELMTRTDFPFPVLGLVHVRNRIEQHRPLRLGDELDLYVRTEDLRPHPRGTQLTLVAEARVSGAVVWRDETTVLRRHVRDEPRHGADESVALPEVAPSGPMRWRLDAGLGRRYAAVSGDRNPIHMTALSARAFGFRRAIAHGMWTKARCLAALAPRLPEAFAVEVAFLKPILLPGEVSFGARETFGGFDFGVRSGADRTHLLGRVTPS